MHLKKSVSIYRLCVGLPFTADIRHSMYDLTTCLHVVIKCEPLHVCVCVCVGVQQMSCGPDWLVFVAAPSCRRAQPRAPLTARASHASTTVICQLQQPSPTHKNTHSLPRPACLLDDAALLTHTYHALCLSLAHTYTHLLLAREHGLQI